MTTPLFANIVLVNRTDGLCLLAFKSNTDGVNTEPVVSVIMENDNVDQLLNALVKSKAMLAERKANGKAPESAGEDREHQEPEARE